MLKPISVSVTNISVELYYQVAILWNNWLELSAVFDLADSNLRIQKLRIYGVEEDFLSCISSYRTDRYQAVWIDHVLSEFLHCEVGVPQ